MMEPVFLHFFWGYVLGSIPFGLILTKLFLKEDIRKIGSGNIGATNVLRTGNKLLAFLTLLFDATKGAFLIVVVYYFGLENCITMDGNTVCEPLNFSEEQHVMMLVLGFGAILGHCYPVWLKFKGGKGVATTFGVLLAAVPWAGFVAAGTWGIVAGFFRYSSLAALSAMAIAPVATIIFYGPLPALMTLFISALVLLRHKDNIQRLIKGDEPKIGQK